MASGLLSATPHEPALARHNERSQPRLACPQMPGLVSLVRHKGPHDMLLLRVDELAERRRELRVKVLQGMNC